MRDGDLKVLGRALVLMEDGVKRAPLDVCEDQPVALRNVVSVGLVLLLLFPFAGCAETAVIEGERKENTTITHCDIQETSKLQPISVFD